jgi:hypothetical protein
MIAFAPTSGVAFYSFDQAVSQTAVSLRQVLAGASAPQTSVGVDLSRQVVQAIVDALEVAAKDGLLVAPDTMARALSFAQSMPADLELADVIVESDGEIGFDWDEGRRRVLSVSIGEGPMLRYAALIGAEPIHGRVPFAGFFPHTLAFLLRRIESVD